MREALDALFLVNNFHIRYHSHMAIENSDFFMPPPLGAGGIMFWDVHPSVRPSEAWNTFFSP